MNPLAREDLLDHVEANFKQLKSSIQEEIKTLNLEIASETKSSAGDKFETSRELMNQSLNQLQSNLNSILEKINAIEQIKKVSLSDRIGFGSLVFTETKTFLFGIAHGSFNFQDNTIYLLSLNSPLAKAFVGKRVNDIIGFHSAKYLIKKIN